MLREIRLLRGSAKKKSTVNPREKKRNSGRERDLFFRFSGVAKEAPEVRESVIDMFVTDWVSPWSSGSLWGSRKCANTSMATGVLFKYSKAGLSTSRIKSCW